MLRNETLQDWQHAIRKRLEVSHRSDSLVGLTHGMLFSSHPVEDELAVQVQKKYSVVKVSSSPEGIAF